MEWRGSNRFRQWGATGPSSEPEISEARHRSLEYARGGHVGLELEQGGGGAGVIRRPRTADAHSITAARRFPGYAGNDASIGHREDGPNVSSERSGKTIEISSPREASVYLRGSYNELASFSTPHPIRETREVPPSRPLSRASSGKRSRDPPSRRGSSMYGQQRSSRSGSPMWFTESAYERSQRMDSTSSHMRRAAWSHGLIGEEGKELQQRAEEADARREKAETQREAAERTLAEEKEEKLAAKRALLLAKQRVSELEEELDRRRELARRRKNEGGVDGQAAMAEELEVKNEGLRVRNEALEEENQALQAEVQQLRSELRLRREEAERQARERMAERKAADAPPSQRSDAASEVRPPQRSQHEAELREPAAPISERGFGGDSDGGGRAGPGAAEVGAQARAADRSRGLRSPEAVGGHGAPHAPAPHRSEADAEGREEMGGSRDHRSRDHGSRDRGSRDHGSRVWSRGAVEHLEESDEAFARMVSDLFVRHREYRGRRSRPLRAPGPSEM